MHKGFKWLNVAYGRVHISHDVVFDETIIPFTKLNPNVGAQLHSEILLLPAHPSGYELLNDPCANVQSSAVENLVSVEQVGGCGDLTILSSVPGANFQDDSSPWRTPAAVDPEASPASAPERDSGTRGGSGLDTSSEADLGGARGSSRLETGGEVDPAVQVHASSSTSPTHVTQAPVEPGHLSHDASSDRSSVPHALVTSDPQQRGAPLVFLVWILQQHRHDLRHV
jgi:hypothetical protein